MEPTNATVGNTIAKTLDDYPYLLQVKEAIEREATDQELKDLHEHLRGLIVGQHNIREVNQCLRLLHACLSYRKVKERDALRRGKVAHG